MSESIRKLLNRSSTFLRRRLSKPAWDFNQFVTDPRHQKGRQWKFKPLMDALLGGFLTNRSSLRGVESLTELACTARIPDTTLYDFLSQFGRQEVEGLRTQLHAQVKTEWRSKSLEPSGLPCGVAAIDNKTLWSGRREAAHDPQAQVVHPKDRPAYAQLRVVRTALVSAASKPVIDQVVIRRETNECGMFREVFATVQASYDALIEVYSMDAAFCSEAHARLVSEAHKGYIFGLKGNQPELFREAERVLGSETQPEVSTVWEKYQGRRVRYHLYRTREMEAYLEWSHLKQVWRIEKQIVGGKTGELEVENRYYVTNLHVGRFQPAQILWLVRSHWAIENNCNWTMDCIWDEDTKVWCGQGVGIQVLGLLRLMAYNLVALLRCRCLRHREERKAEKRRWQELCDLLFLLIVGEVNEIFPKKQATMGR